MHIIKIVCSGVLAGTLIIVALAYFLVSPGYSFAISDVIFLPAEFESLGTNDEFKLQINITPSGVVNYDSKIIVTYPQNLLTLNSFELGNDWLPLSGLGNNLNNPEIGLFVVSGLYPNKLTDEILFGEITFITKNPGYGSITLESNSEIISEKDESIGNTEGVQTLIAIGTDLRLEKLPVNYLFANNLEIGDEGIAVTYLQLCLQLDDVYTKDIDGKFDAATEIAVLLFQEKYLDVRSGKVEEATISGLNEICIPRLPAELFDIELSIEDDEITIGGSVTAVVTFENFGRIPTLIDTTFLVVNESEQVLYRDVNYTIVQTENVLRNKLSELNLKTGEYTLVLETKYSGDIIDKFEQDFTVTRYVDKQSIVFVSIFLMVVIGILTYIIILRIRKKEKTLTDMIN